MKKSLNPQELMKLSNTLSSLEVEILRNTGLRKINGAFALVEMFGFDDDFIDIQLKFGTQDESGSYVTTENRKMNRKTMQIED
jgi:hypothetical protein